MSRGAESSPRPSSISWRRLSPAHGIALAYALLAALWILLSDRALELLASPEELVRWGVYKGLAFVLVTGAFLFVLLKRTYGVMEAGYRELRSHQDEIKRLNRLNTVLSLVNQAIVRLPGREDLCRRVCQILVEEGGFRVAWIAWHETGKPRLVPLASAGAEDPFLAAIVRDEVAAEALGPASRAFREDAPVVINDLWSDPRALAWQADLKRLGLCSVVGIPVHREGGPGGVITVYANQPGIFHEREVSLLLEAAADLAFGLDNITREARRREAELRRREAEENQRESEERFRATFEQAAVGIAHVAPDGCLLRVNDKLCTIAGQCREKLIGLRLTSLILAEDQAPIEEGLRALLAGERGDLAAERRFWREEGGAIWTGLVVSLLRGSAGTPRYFIVVVTDISERKRLEEQFLRAQRLESVGTLAGGVAHDLNNLLAPIMMGLELIRMGGVSPSLTPVVDNMERSVRRGAGLVRQVLSFARGLDGVRTRLPLRHLLNEVGMIVESSFPKNIRWDCDLPRDLWPVRGDANQLHQVLLNLCVNARDAMPGGGTLRVSARNVSLAASEIDAPSGESPGPHVLLEVADDGCGMTPAVLGKISEPFFTTKPPDKGTGLGLSTALGIVRGHGGRIAVKSEPGCGTVFLIHLPAEPDTVSADDARFPRVRPALGRGELVLVVDDESSIRDIIRQTLEASGYRVLTAKDGVQAAAIYAQHHASVAVVISDMLMPMMDGPALIGELRRINPRVRVIGVSGQPTENEAASPPVGAPACFLQKPFAGDALLALLRQVVDAPENSPP
jgi:PAS domain S-box-containing protein